MKLFVCMCALFAVANATFLGLLKGGNGGGGSGNVYAPNYGHGGQYIRAPPKIINVRIIDDHVPALGRGHGPAANVKVLKVIHQKSSRDFRAVTGPPSEVIRLIHENAVGDTGSFVSTPTKVIRVIHEKAQAYDNGAYVATPVNTHLLPVQSPVHAPAPQYGAPAFQQSAPIPQYSGQATTFTAVGNSGSFVSAPSKVIRVIHEQAQAYDNSAFTASASVAAPINTNLPPVQSLATAYIAPTTQYGAPDIQQSAPVPQYNPQATTFTAPEPVPIQIHAPAQSYGLPHK